MKNQVRLHFTGTFSPHHAGEAATTRRHLGSGTDPRPPNPGRPLAIGDPESSSPLVRFQSSLRPLPRRLQHTRLLSGLNPLFTHHTHARRVLIRPGESRDRGKGEFVRTRRSGRSSVPPGPAPTCRPRVRGRRRQRPVLAEDEFEVELVVGATVCSSHRRGPGSCGSSSGDGDGDGSSAPLHAGPRRPGGRDSATNFPGGDRDSERTVPNYRASRAQNRTRSWRHCQSLVPNPPQWL